MTKDLKPFMIYGFPQKKLSNLSHDAFADWRYNVLSNVNSVFVCIMLLLASLTFVPTEIFAQRQAPTKKKTNLKKKKPSKKVIDILAFAPVKENNEEEEDGAQERLDYEFNRTKDPVLNIVPQYKLMDALKQHNASVMEQQIFLSKKAKSIISGKELNINGTTAPIGNLTWQERGPNVSKGPNNDNNPSVSGRSDAIWIDIDPALPNQAFLGGNNGGLWSCTDVTQAAPAWTYKDNFANIAISSICQDPTNFNIMYFGTGEKLARVVGGGIWKSTDHGNTWNFLANTSNFYNVTKVLCDKNGYLYAGMVQYVKTGTQFSNGGLARSKDGGTTWTYITPTVNGINSNQVSDMVYDASIDRMGVYLGYQYSGETQGYCYGQPSTIASSTWSTPVSAAAGLGLFAQINNTTPRITQTVLSAKGGVVWALQGYSGGNAAVNGGSYSNLYFSADGGANWALKRNITSALFDQGQNWYALAIDCDPQSPANNVVIGGLNPFKSTDGGVNLTQVARWVASSQGGPVAQYVHADIHGIYYNTTAAGLNRIICMDDGGINYSGDGGTTWQDRNVGLRTLEFYSVATNPSDQNNYLAGAQDNGSHQFTLPGLAADFQISGGDGAMVAIDQMTPNNQVTSYIYNNYYISSDKGVNLNNSYTSTSIDQTGQFINPFDFDGRAKKLYASTSAGQYLRWDDPLTTKNTYPKITVPAISGSVITAITVSPNLNNTIYLAAGQVVVMVANSNTASPTFKTITPPVISAGSNISSIVVGPSSTDQDLIVTSSSYGTNKVFISADGGNSWVNITGNLPDVPVNWSAFYANSNTQIYLATNLGLWYTTSVNGSSTVWLADGSIPKVSCKMLKYSDATNTLALATYGRGLWTAKTSTTPKISFYPSLLTATKAFSNTAANCRLYVDFSDTLLISDPPTGAATASLSVQSGGSATLGADFDFTTNGSFSSPSSSVIFNNNVYPNRIPITIRVYNNKNKSAAIPLTVNLGITISGSTDAQISTLNQNLVVNLADNIVPIPTTTVTNQTVWTENWDSWPATKSSWVFSPDLDNKPSSATLFAPAWSGSCSTQGISSTNVELFGTNTSGTLATCGGNSTNSSPKFYRAIFGRDNYYSNIKVTFDYKSLNGADNNNLMYSLDNGTTWALVQNFPTQSSTTNVIITLPAVLHHMNFLLGWRSSGSNLSGFAVDNISVVADITPPAIETVASSANNYYINRTTNIDAYSTNNNIFSNITNASADLGCVTASIENVGNSWQPYLSGTRSQKTFVLTPATNAVGTTYKASFYFTNAELGGLNVANLKLAKTEAASVATSTSANTTSVTPTTTTYNSTGVIFTGTFTGFSRYFLTDQNVVLPIELVSFTGNIVNHSTVLDWVTSSEINNKEFDVQWSMDGVSFTALGVVASKGNSSINQSYRFTHNYPMGGLNYYRLKQTDLDGKVTYSKIIVLNLNIPDAEPFLYPNPANKSININLGSRASHADVLLYSLDMRLLRKLNLNIVGLTSNIDISQLLPGVYFIQVNKNEKKVLLRFVKE